MMRRVVVTRSAPGRWVLEGVEFVVGPEEGLLEPKALRRFVAEAQPVDALVTMFHDRVDAALLGAAGERLSIVCNYASGYENIDLAACAAGGVTVCNTPDAVTEGAANMAWALLLAAARRLHEAGQYVRSPAYPAKGPLGMGDFLGVDVAGATLLIVGAGRIGSAVAFRALGFGMRVMYVARSPKPLLEQAPLCAQRVSLEEGLAQADFVSLHVPLTEQTRRLIGPRELSLMKPTAVLVNVSRGQVVDEEALVAALREGRLFAAGLDVFEREPHVHPELLELPNAVLTPHIGSAERGSRKRMTERILRNLRAHFAGSPAPDAVALPSGPPV